MNDPIDIVIPWVNPFDVVWQQDFRHYKLLDSGDCDFGRFRDCNTLRYVLRSIEKNCLWCRYVFLVLASSTQIPSWLNTICPRLKIVYHKDYIPSEYLPTFNTNVIEIFYSNIEELSDNFILCNDDTFFCETLPDTFFFIDNKPVYNLAKEYGFSDTDWGVQLSNSLNAAKLVMQTNVDAYSTHHLPVSYSKGINAFCLYKLGSYIWGSLGNSRFRTRTDILQNLFYYVTIKLGRFVADSRVRGKFYFFDNSKPIYDFNYPMVCLNESGMISNEDIGYMVAQLDRQFPSISCFEKPE